MNTKVIPFIRVESKKNEPLEKKIAMVFGSDDKFADAIGANSAFISRIVNGEASLSPKEKDIWASALNVNQAELFSVNR